MTRQQAQAIAKSIWTGTYTYGSCLKLPERAVLTALAFACDGGPVSAGYEELADRCGLSKRSVQRAIGELCQMRVIRLLPRDAKGQPRGLPNTYEILITA
jgi:hypothetical protein